MSGLDGFMDEGDFMGISSIGSLFASKMEAPRQQQQSAKQDANTQQPTQVQRSTVSTDAVVFSRSVTRMMTSSPPATEDKRPSRVEQIRAEISDKSYSVDTDKVAVAVLKDLA